MAPQFAVVVRTCETHDFENTTDHPPAKDQQCSMLFSRVAGLGELKHRPIGFTGALSHHVLGYNSIINLVRQSLRDLMETTVTNICLTGCCDRSALDLSEVATE